MDCAPPWLSSQNHCQQNINIRSNHTKEEVQTLINENFWAPKWDRKLTKAETKCEIPCKKMTNLISLRASEGGEKVSNNYSAAYLELRFKKTVKVEKKILSYTGFNFIIDVGSSLGLWLGLSALGITDLALEAFVVVRKWLKLK